MNRLSLFTGLLAFASTVLGSGVSSAPELFFSTSEELETPVAFAPGTDYDAAERLGFAADFVSIGNGASYALTISGLSGGAVTIDSLVALNLQASIDSYRLQIATPLTGTLSTPTTFKGRLWTGTEAPLHDADGQVCAVLDFLAPLHTESTGSCSTSSHLQVTLGLPWDSSGSSRLGLRLSGLHMG